MEMKSMKNKKRKGRGRNREKKFKWNGEEKGKKSFWIITRGRAGGKEGNFSNETGKRRGRKRVNSTNANNILPRGQWDLG